MPIHYGRTFEIADMTLRFPEDAGRIDLELFPTALKDHVVPRRTSLRGKFFIDALPGNDPWPAFVVESLAEVKVAGDPYPGAFATGPTMRSSSSANAFVLEAQQVEQDGDASRIVTTIRSAAGHRIEHRLSWRTGDRAAEVSIEFFNDSAAPVTLEMLARFAFSYAPAATRAGCWWCCTRLPIRRRRLKCRCPHYPLADGVSRRQSQTARGSRTERCFGRNRNPSAPRCCWFPAGGRKHASIRFTA